MRTRAFVTVALMAVLGLLSRGALAPQGDAGEAAPADATTRANRLASESSPYLQLHAHNPVDWYPWGDEAISRARRENKPIFLSVGYSTCYWCHVMERESFSDPAVAAFMNEHFVNIKVDREERPDLDEIYITATQLLAGSAGWPTSVFLTPELAPFFAGTYFPPDDRAGRPGFQRLLTSIAESWSSRRSEIEAHAARVAEVLAATVAQGEAAQSELPGAEVIDRAASRLGERFDSAHGGFSRAPKFPSPGNLFFLWRRGERGDAEARRMVLETLAQMGRGAIYDHLDGGFHRYTLDERWRVPHFEKMLYDNAHLGELLAIAAAATGEPEFERLARGTFDFVLDEMTLADGAFKSAIDAETDAVEGAYYIWRRDELTEVLDDEGFALLAPIYGFDGAPNFEHGTYTLYLTASLEDHAERLGTTRDALLRKLEPNLERLRRYRRERKFPLVDDKVLTDWNGMMIAGLASAGRLLEEPRYVRAAERAAGFVLARLDSDEGPLMHTWRNGTAKVPAFLDDYAFLLRGLLELDRATGSGRWLDEAEELVDELEARLADPMAGGYFFSAADPLLLLRTKTVAGGAIPAGNSVAILALVELAERTGESAYRKRAERSLRGFAPQLVERGHGLPTLAWALDRFVETARSADVRALPVAADGAESPTYMALNLVRGQASTRGLALADGWRRFELSLEIEDGWHINANPPSSDYLRPTEVLGARGLRYPPGEEMRFEFNSEPISVYSGATRISGELDPEKTRTVPVSYQVCDERRCLPPVTQEFRLMVSEPRP